MEWSLLTTVSEETRRHVLAGAQRRRFRRGETIVRAGERADSLHLVSSGRLAVRVSTERGGTALLNVLVPGDYFGEIALVDSERKQRSATVVALQASETLSISRDAFQALRAAHPAVDQLVVMLLARRVDELSTRLVEVMYEPLEIRVRRRLDSLAARYSGDRGTDMVRLSITQSDLAELVGATRPAVNVVLRSLRDAGAIALERGHVLVDRVALRHGPAGQTATPVDQKARRCDAASSAIANDSPRPLIASMKSSRPIASNAVSTCAVTVAVRGMSRRTPISPKNSPGPS